MDSADSRPSAQAFAVVMKDALPQHKFDLIEMQGEVIFMDPLKEAQSLASPLPSPLGTLLLPETGKGCTLRMGTLSLAGDAGNVKTPMIVLKRVRSAPPVKRLRTEGENGRDADDEASLRIGSSASDECRTLPDEPILLSDAWEQGLLRGDDAANASDSFHYEIVGSVVKRYHFKSKTTRQFNK